jgi:hypothetical protein
VIAIRTWTASVELDFELTRLKPKDEAQAAIDVVHEAVGFSLLALLASSWMTSTGLAASPVERGRDRLQRGAAVVQFHDSVLGRSVVRRGHGPGKALCLFAPELEKGVLTGFVHTGSGTRTVDQA